MRPTTLIVSLAVNDYFKWIFCLCSFNNSLHISPSSLVPVCLRTWRTHPLGDSASLHLTWVSVWGGWWSFWWQWQYICRFNCKQMEHSTPGPPCPPQPRPLWRFGLLKAVLKHGNCCTEPHCDDLCGLVLKHRTGSRVQHDVYVVRKISWCTPDLMRWFPKAEFSPA